MVLELKAQDRSTYVVNAQFFDEDSNPVVPVSIQWTLYSGLDQVVNGRQDVVVTPPAQQIDIVLTRDDLDESESRIRRLLVEALYDSTAGTGLSLRAQARFEISSVRD